MSVSHDFCGFLNKVIPFLKNDFKVEPQFLRKFIIGGVY